MNLPDFIRSHAPTLSLIVRAKLLGELPGTSYDDAWDALESPEDYAPGPEIEAWMRENWHGVIFGAQPQPDTEEIPDISTVSRTLVRVWMPPFLSKFVETGGNATAAAEYAGIDPSTPYKSMKVDKAFAHAWELAERKVADVIRQEIYRRGVEGWEEPVFGTLGGKFAGEGCIGAVRKFDSSLLIKMATARVPEYRTLVKEGAAQVNASASASASSSSTSVAMSTEEIEKLQARKQRQLEKQAARNERLQMSKVGNN